MRLEEKGRVRYLGITHYVSSAYPELAKLLRTEQLDFLQINYSLLVEDNMQAGVGRLPEPGLRHRMIDTVSKL